ncbi:hypothetical protein [uncultured Winogradskyella sp.]|uniref:hypothetical protein n=1 Tax=Winogradskyella sp. 4-2091 TaxID=3381659 RepID=UPI0026357EFB|nr:hypothetical protein [uncultured Winogradskyella sp.]
MQNKNMLASVLVFFVGFASMAQSTAPPPPIPPPPPGLPIDNGIIVLFVLALGFGAYKAYTVSKKTA